MFHRLLLNSSLRNIMQVRYLSNFANKHIGIRGSNLNKMLETCNVKSLPELTKQSININRQPSNILKNIPEAMTEKEASAKLSHILSQNKSHISLLGMGYHNNVTPKAISRHVLENPKWYTAYTPYQAEISQGRLEAQDNYQTVIKELTGLPITNASLLDEASTSAEVLNMCFNYQNKNKKKTFLVSSDLHPQILEVLRTKANILDVNLEIIDFKKWDQNIDLMTYDTLDYHDVFGIMFSYPNTYGEIYIPHNIINFFKENPEVSICANTDILSLVKIHEPNSLGIDICFGTSQRLGIPMYYGGPHPAFLASQKKYLRLIPGRIVGTSVDTLGKDCFRLGLQTREQHIRKQKATSNICTSQSLLANVVGFYCYYLGKEGLNEIASDIHNKTQLMDYYLGEIGINNLNDNYFDTITFESPLCPNIYSKLRDNDIILRKITHEKLSISMDETITIENIHKIIHLIYELVGQNITFTEMQKTFNAIKIGCNSFHSYRRKNIKFMECDKFKEGKTETELLRYIHQLLKKDYTLCEGMIPLGSCTMKLNASYQLEPLSNPQTQSFHPYLPKEYVEGYHQLFEEFGGYLKDITGFTHVSFQSNSGAMGEYSGLLCIRKYHEERGHYNRKICLIPKSAHGTNFSSAQLAGFKVVSYDDQLNLSLLEEFVKKYSDNLGCLMITYPGTDGIFQKDIKEICGLIHKYGGLVYLDGANMNAQVGLSNPALSGADVCHLNLHKTFCIPHGGGGPGMGPILCNNKLGEYLPSNAIQNPEYNNSNTIGMITGSNWSSASLLTIPYLYILGMGSKGLKRASETAILNANYLKDKLKTHYTITDINEYGRVAHEFIIDTSEFREYKITELDIAKRLIDYSFHPPTMSWPRNNVLMFEPTESENLAELDRLVEALVSIRQEIDDIIKNKNYENNILKNSPHSLDLMMGWNHEYSMEKAYYPVPNLKKNKFWPTNTRINDIEGDKKLLS